MIEITETTNQEGSCCGGCDKDWDYSDGGATLIPRRVWKLTLLDGNGGASFLWRLCDECLEVFKGEAAEVLGQDQVFESWQDRFQLSWGDMARECHWVARRHGWWGDEAAQGDHHPLGPRNEAEMIALMHAELSEALEGLREGNQPSNHIPEFSAVEEELADLVIRIMDNATARGWDIAGALLAKWKFNATRPYRHGGKTC